MSKVGFVLLSLIFILSCQNQSSEANSSMGTYPDQDEAMNYDQEILEEPPRTAEPPPPDFTLDKGSKIIKNGSMNFEVNGLEKAKTRIDSMISKYDGYFENEQFDSYGNRVSYALLLRIPTNNFDALVSSLERGLGSLKSKNITAKDVTEEYVDLTIRLENNLAYLSQYKVILRKAKSVKEILEVKEKIRRIEEEIESKKGRLKFLDDKVKYSTLNIEISELITAKISNKPSFGRRIANSFNYGIRGFLNFLVGLVNFWPFLLLITVIIIARKPIIKRMRK